MSFTILDLGTCNLKCLTVNRETGALVTESFDFSRMFPQQAAQNYSNLLKLGIQEKISSWSLKENRLHVLLSSGLVDVQVAEGSTTPGAQAIEKIDPRTGKTIKTTIELNSTIRKGLNRCFESFGCEIEFLGASTMALIDFLCENNQSELNLLCHLGNSSMVLAVIRGNTLLEYREFNDISGFELDQILMDQQTPALKDCLNKKEQSTIFLPIQDETQHHVQEFLTLQPFLCKLVSFLTKEIARIESIQQDTLSQVYLSGGGFRIKSFDRFLENEIDRQTDYYSHTFLSEKLDFLSLSADSYSDFSPLLSHYLLENLSEIIE